MLSRVFWEIVEGKTLPKRVGGHPALDFCNTLAGWSGPPLPKGEWLADAETFLVWCSYADLVDESLLPGLCAEAARRPAKARSLLKQAQELRGNLYAALVDGDPAAFAEVARVAERSASRARLVRTSEGHASWELPAQLGLDLPLLAVARAAADLLVSRDRSAVRVCPGDECGWVFLDRRGRRRWCSMETCGNRAKAKAFAERRRASA